MKLLQLDQASLVLTNAPALAPRPENYVSEPMLTQRTGLTFDHDY